MNSCESSSAVASRRASVESTMNGAGGNGCMVVRNQTALVASARSLSSYIWKSTAQSWDGD